MTSSTAAPAASVDEKARLRHGVTVLIAVARVGSTFREAQGIVGEQPGTADGSAAKAHDRASRWTTAVSRKLLARKMPPPQLHRMRLHKTSRRQALGKNAFCS